MSEHHPYSPSKLGALVAGRCEGKIQLEETVPYEDTSSESASFGTEAHAEIAQLLETGRPPSEITTESIKNHRVRFLVDRCIAWLTRYWPHDAMGAHIEKRISILSGSRRNELTFGTPDILVESESNGVVVFDWKFYNELLDATDARLQVLAYLLGGMQEYGVEHGVGRLYLPLLDIDYVVETTLEDAQDEIEATIRMAQRPGAPRRPGKWCGYCRAKEICPEVRERAAEIAYLASHFDATTKKALRAELEARCDAWIETGQFDKVVALADAGEYVVPAIEAARSRVKEQLERGREIRGWKLRTVRQRSVPSVRDLWERVEGTITEEEFASCLSVTLGKLEEHYQARVAAEAAERGQKLPKTAASDLLDAQAGDAIVTSTRVELRRTK